MSLLFLQAAFVPASDSALDTSYFTSRYSWNTSDDHVYASSQYEDSGDSDSMSDSSCISNRPDEVVSNMQMLSFHIHFISMQLSFNLGLVTFNGKQEDECGGLTEFEPGSEAKYTFSNFSFKVCLWLITHAIIYMF